MVEEPGTGPTGTCRIHFVPEPPCTQDLAAHPTGCELRALAVQRNFPKTTPVSGGTPAEVCLTSVPLPIPATSSELPAPHRCHLSQK